MPLSCLSPSFHLTRHHLRSSLIPIHLTLFPPALGLFSLNFPTPHLMMAPLQNMSPSFLYIIVHPPYASLRITYSHHCLYSFICYYFPLPL